MNTCRLREALALSISLPALVAGLPALAETTPAEEIDEVVIVGVRAENTKIVSEKRQTDGISDFLGEDEAGRLPDLNIAESLSRIPGVQAIFDEDRGRFVTVRGLSANLNYVTIDGLGVATTDEFGGTGRKVNLEVIPSNAVGLLEVRKTFTPDIDGGAIGGYVNLHTRSAFDRRTPFFAVEGGLNYQTYQRVPNANSGESPITGKTAPQIDAVYANSFGSNDQFGLVIAARFAEDKRDKSKNIQAAEAYYSHTGTALNPILADGTVNPNWNGYTAPAQVRSYDYTNKIRDYGLNLKLEYRSDKLYSSLLGYYYAENQQETRNAIQYLSMDQVRNQTAESGTLRLGQVRIGWNFNPLDRQNYGTIFNTRYKLDERRSLDFKAGWSFNDFDDFQPNIDFRGRPSNRSLTYETIRSDPATQRFVFADTAGILTPSNYTLNAYQEQRRYSRENVYNAKLDYGVNQDKGAAGWGYKFGAELRRLDRERDNSRTDYVSNGVALTDYALQTDFQPYFLNFPLLWVDAHKFLAEVVPTLAVNAASTAERAIIEDYRYVEDTRAAYGLATYTGERFRFVGGLRYEDVATEATTPGEVLSAGFSTREGGYGEWLPSATLALDLTPDVRLKLGASRSLGRPNPGDIAQRERRSETNQTISRGNPDLKPRISTNLDLGLEYYLPARNGLLAVSVFTKDIKDEIFTLARDEEIDGEIWRVTQPRNAQGAKVKGIELNAIVNQFGFVAPWLKPFGISGNVTRVDGEIDYIDGNGNFARSDRLVDQAKWIGNAAVFYAAHGFEARVNYNHRGDYIDDIATNPWEAQGWDDFHTVDLSLSYKVDKHWQIKFKARNLENENRRRIRGLGLSDLYEEVEFGRSFYLTLKYRN